MEAWNDAPKFHYSSVPFFHSPLSLFTPVQTFSYLGSALDPRHSESDTRNQSPVSCHPTLDPVLFSHFSNAKIRFQSFFMLMTVQAFFFACAISASVNVPTLDFGP